MVNRGNQQLDDIVLTDYVSVPGFERLAYSESIRDKANRMGMSGTYFQEGLAGLVLLWGLQHNGVWPKVSQLALVAFNEPNASHLKYYDDVVDEIWTDVDDGKLVILNTGPYAPPNIDPSTLKYIGKE